MGRVECSTNLGLFEAHVSESVKSFGFEFDDIGRDRASIGRPIGVKEREAF